MNTAPLSQSKDAGVPCKAIAERKTSTTSAALAVGKAREAKKSLEWSSIMLRISTSPPSASRQWVMSACHISLGSCASKRSSEERGRFCG